MSLIYENIRSWLLKEIMESGNPFLFWNYVLSAAEEMEPLIEMELAKEGEVK